MTTREDSLASPADAPVQGYCDTRFAAVREQFQQNFVDRSETGAALAVTLDGDLVIDLHGGWTDAKHTKPWAADTIVCCYSVGKAICAILSWRLAERGELDIDRRVADYWPEFAQNGKADIPVRWILTHQSGLPAIRKPLPRGAMLNWDVMTSALAEQAPWWEPGTAHGYHSNTQGFLIGEVIRRVTGRSIGEHLQSDLSEPTGLDFHFGTKPEHDVLTADMLPMQQPPDFRRAPPSALQTLGNRNPPHIQSGPGSQNTREYRAAEFPSTTGHGAARGIARLFGALARDGQLDGFHVLDPVTIEQMSQEQVYGVDYILGRPTRFASGFQMTMTERPLGPNPRTFGHFGGGGSLAFADPDARVGWGYVMNQGRGGWQHRHTRKLLDLLYEAL
ncbi:MAG: beta-lactamase family protein [Chloroflexi bacterium]|nr:beta-lactamase family protein [Chloroflexota bacterium]MYF82133.1 beta-lactamase family protein [Chloroflexota bacterium]MYI04740.1 beta-lactamase family protein [Chloroflexota bacterium]